MPRFFLDVDETTDEIFSELESHTQGRSSHKCELEASSALEAAETLVLNLIPFFESRFKEAPPEEEE